MELHSWFNPVHQSSPSEIRNALLKTASHYNSPDSITGFGVPNIFLAYLYLNGQKIPELGSEEAFQILPNPFEDEIFVYFSSSSAKSLDCNIYNLNGKKVRAFKNLNPVIGNNIFCLSGLHSLKAGVYMITLSDDEKIYTRKIVKAE